MIFDGANTDDRPNRPLNPYLGINNLYFYSTLPTHLLPDISSVTRCPSDRCPYSGGGSVFQTFGSSYCCNSRGTKVGNAHNGLDGQDGTFAAVANPSLVVLACDYAINYAYFLFEYGNSSQPAGATPAGHRLGQRCLRRWPCCLCALL